MNKEMVAHPHIAKTGGTTMRCFYDETWGKENVLLYNPLNDTFRRDSDMRSVRYPTVFALKEALMKTPLRPIVTHFVLQLSKIKDERDISWEEIPYTDHRAITGHFSADRLNLLPDHFKTVVLRDPLQRMYSHYCHWRREDGNARFDVMTPWDRNMRFEEFAMLPELQNFQTRVLAKTPLENFDLVGTTENLGGYTQKLVDKLGLEGCGQNIGQENRVTNKAPLVVSEGFIRDFRELHAADYDLYERAKIL